MTIDCKVHASRRIPGDPAVFLQHLCCTLRSESSQSTRPSQPMSGSDKPCRERGRSNSRVESTSPRLSRRRPARHTRAAPSKRDWLVLPVTSSSRDRTGRALAHQENIAPTATAAAVLSFVGLTATLDARAGRRAAGRLAAAEP